jgi:crotonobetainyl-CoA:carnitine CoA-transferase CaiB-like acyl-CoA transferase
MNADRHMTAPLEGVRVVEVAGWMAAPGAAVVLADLGADVVKVEPLRGDPVRGVIRQPEVDEPFDAPFHMDNRGKRGIAVALDRPEGQELVRRLVDGADVFVNNLLLRRQQRFGLDAETLLARAPRLVHATMTGYGLEGPDAARPGFDITTFFGRGGITHAITEPGGQAPRARPAQGDHAAALALVAAVLAALRLVERTGQGQVVDVNLLATAAWTMSTDLSTTLVDGQDPPRSVGADAGTRCRRASGPRTTAGSCCSCPSPTGGPASAPWPGGRVGRRPAPGDRRGPLRAHAARHRPHGRAVRTRTLAEWGQAFDEAGLTWGPAATVSEVAADPHLHAVGAFPTVEHPVVGTFRTVAVPMKLRGATSARAGPAPELGQHTREVLRELGLSEAEVDAAVADGVVGAGG